MSRSDERLAGAAASSPRVAVLASGRGSNFESLARAFRAGELPGKIVVLVVDKRGARAREIAERFAIPSVYVRFRRGERQAFDRQLVATLREHAVDFVFLAGFLRILGRSVVDAYWGRIVNIHPSLLPDFPGLGAHAQALAAGVRESGCTVHFVDHGVDSGPTILQRRVPVLPGDDEETLSARILEQEHRLYPEAARRVLTGRARMEGERVLEEDSP